MTGRRRRRPGGGGGPAAEGGRPAGDRGEPDRWERRDGYWAWAAGLATTGIAGFLSSFLFGRIPHVQDSIAQLFQARIFAEGRLWAPAPPLPEFFAAAQMILKGGRWYSQYPPGHSLLQVPGVWAGVPWLTNPALGGLAIAGVFLLTFELFGRTPARIAAVFGALSPFVLLMSAGFMSHASSFFAATYFLFFYFRTVRAWRRRDAALAGMFLALAILTRPLTALGIALPVMGHAVWTVWRERTRAAGPFAVLAGIALAGISLLLLYNWGTTGSPTKFGYTELYGPSHGLGFGKGSWGPPHTLARGLGAAWFQVRHLDARLFEWPLPSLLGLLDPRLSKWPLSSLWPILPALLVPRSASRVRRASLGRRWLLASVPVSLLGVYVFYWYQDQCFGPRFVYEAVGPLLALVGVGVWIVSDRLGSWIGRGRAVWGRRVPGVLLFAVLFLSAGMVRWPALFREPAFAVGRPPESKQRQASYFAYFGREYWGVSPYLGNLVDKTIHGRALVFTRFAEQRQNEPLPLRYLWFGSAFARQRPDLDQARVIYARDLGETDRELIARFPDRRAYLYQGTIQHGSLSEIR